MYRPKIVVVGLNFGRHIVHQLAEGDGQPWCQLAGVCDLDQARAAELAARYNVPVWPSLEEVLASPEVDAVGLFVGPAGRAQLLRRVVDAGKHVMTTKPLETDADAAIEVLHHARNIGKVLHLNSPAPVPAPDLATITRWQQQFQLGQPVGARTDIWVRYQEQTDGTWLDDPERCPVAPLFRLGIYLINDLLHIMGPAQQVQVLASRIFTGRPTPDNAQLSIQFESGALANIYASFCVNDGDYYRNGLTLNFENGTVYRNVGPVRSQDETSLLSLVQFVDGARQVVAQESLHSRSGAYDWESFARAVGGETLQGELEPEAQVAGLRVISAMARAAQSGRTEPVI